MVDRDERQKVVFDMEKLIYEESPSIALAYPNNIEAYRNDLVTDFTPVPGPTRLPDPELQQQEHGHGPTRVPGAESTTTSQAGLPAWAWGLVIVAVAMWSIWLYRRGDRPDEEEG